MFARKQFNKLGVLKLTFSILKVNSATLKVSLATLKVNLVKRVNKKIETLKQKKRKEKEL